MSPRSEQLLFRPNVSGSLSVCLAYPNTYEVAMANLGYQAVFRILATQPGVVCERALLDPRPAHDGERRHALTPLRTLESGRPAADFDVVAFSLSFESDYPNIVRMLDAAGIPARASERRASGRRWPVLVAGGPATFLNPEPVAPFFDVFLIGEGEEMIPEAFAGAEAWAGGGGDETIERLGAVAGAYRPDLYEPRYDDAGELTGYQVAPGAPARITRRYLTDLDRFPTTTSVVAPDAVFGDYYLVEASRGCEWGCRFCAAGFMYRPVRHRSSDGVVADALAGLAHARTVGLVGAEMASHPGLATTCERVGAAGGRVSPSSLKADMISPRLARALASSGTRSVTVAPEAGSERMRRVINKNLSEAEILRAADLMVGDGVDSLKLYYMCALPTETSDDLDGIYELTVKIRERMIGRGRARGRVGRIKVSVNPFVPKPWTPFQWDAMLPVAEAQRRIARLRRAFGRLPNVEMESESPREAYLQTLLSRGDRRVAAVVECLARGGSARNRANRAGSDGVNAARSSSATGPAGQPGEPRQSGQRGQSGWWRQLQAMRRGEHAGVDVDPDAYVTREYPTDAVFPWDLIDHHIDRAYLLLERRRALAERETEPCDVATCHTCGAC